MIKRCLIEPKRKGFSLIEVLCVMALLGGITAWIAYNQTGLGNFLTRLSPEEVFRRTAQEARYQSALRNEPIQLAWDNEAQSFRLSSPTQTLDIDPTTYGEDLLFTVDTMEIWFAPTSPTEGEPVSGRPEDVDYETPIPLRLTFLPTGVSRPGEVIFRIKDADERRLTLDAFSAGANTCLIATR